MSLGVYGTYIYSSAQIAPTLKGWTEVSSYTLAGAVASISFTGLDLDTDGMYMLVYRVETTQAGGSNILLEYNADTTATNYYNQLIKATATTLSGARENNPKIAVAIAANEANMGVIYITRCMGSGSNKYTRAICSSQGDSAAAVILHHIVHVWNATANVTSVEMLLTNFAIGSKFTLLKCTPSA